MKPIYIGVMLDDPKVLQRWWESEVGELLPKRIAHHMTIKFGPSADEVAALPVGEPVTLEVVGYANSGEIQAVVVRPHGVESANRIPHVTVATDGATSPVKSNDLLADGWERVKGPTLKGKVGFFAGGRDWFDLGVLGRTASVRIALRNADPVPSAPVYYAGVLGPTVTYTADNPRDLTRGKRYDTQVVRVDTNRGTVDFDMSWTEAMSRRQGLPTARDRAWARPSQQTYVIPSGDVAFAGMSNTQTVKLLRHLMSADPRVTPDFRIVNSERYRGRTVGDVAGDPRDVDVVMTGRGRGGMPTPLVAYHGTSTMRAKTILKEGFVPGRQRFTYEDQVPGYSEHNVYLTVNPEDAENYATRQAIFDKSNAAVLRVTIPPEEMKNIVFDEDTAKGWVKLDRNYLLTLAGEPEPRFPRYKALQVGGYRGYFVGDERQHPIPLRENQLLLKDEIHVGTLLRWVMSGAMVDDDEFRALVSAVYDPKRYLKTSLRRGLITYAGTIPASWVELFRTYPRVKYPAEDSLRFDEYQRIRQETQEKMVRHVAARSMK